MTPGPELDWLSHLTPNGSLLDPADVLFNAGRASARTPRTWKFVAAGQLLANAVMVGILLSGRDPQRPPAVTSAPAAVPAPTPAHAPTPESPPGRDPNSIASLAHSLDPDTPPPPAGFVPPDRPAAPLAVGSLGVTD